SDKGRGLADRPEDRVAAAAGAVEEGTGLRPEERCSDIARDYNLRMNAPDQAPPDAPAPAPVPPSPSTIATATMPATVSTPEGVSPQLFVDWLRTVAPYIHAFRGKTFVI